MESMTLAYLSSFQSSDDLTSLPMPVGYKVLKAVIDFMYTDEIQVLEGTTLGLPTYTTAVDY